MDYVSINGKKYVTPKAIIEMLSDRGITISMLTVHWHCRYGRLSQMATKIGHFWHVPLSTAHDFVDTYQKQKGGARRNDQSI